MSREATKLRILEKGAELILLQGFASTGIQDILLAAEVPKGSFYFYFKSKQDFGLQLIDFFEGFYQNAVRQCLDDLSLQPLERLKAFYRFFREYAGQQPVKRGCPIGNLSQELSPLNEAFRQRLEIAWIRMRRPIEQCLLEAQDRDEVTKRFSATELATFALNAWEGALIDVKLTNSTRPLELFEQMLFDNLLKVTK